MNKIEREELKVLQKGKSEFGVNGLKMSLEDEKLKYPTQVTRFRAIAFKANLPLGFKIGGPNAGGDLYLGLDVEVDRIVAPMVETRYALQEYLKLIEDGVAEDNREDIEFAFNLETITGVQNLDAMLKLPNLKLLTGGITVGRVDLVGSMELDEKAINGQQVFDICREVFTKAKKAGLKTALGGGIDLDAIPIIQKLDEAGLLDMFETRNVCFRANSWRFGEPALEIAGEFEIWNGCSFDRYGSRPKAENKKRLAKLVKRWGKKGEEIFACAQKIIAEVTT